MKRNETSQQEETVRELLRSPDPSRRGFVRTAALAAAGVGAAGLLKPSSAEAAPGARRARAPAVAPMQPRAWRCTRPRVHTGSSSSSGAPWGQRTSPSSSSTAASATPTSTTAASTGGRSPSRSWPRAGGRRGRRRLERQQVQGRLPRRRRVHGELLPPLRAVRERDGAVLRERQRLHLRLQGPRRVDDPGGLLHLQRGGRGLRDHGPGRHRPRSCRADDVRRDHRLLTAAPLEHRAGSRWASSAWAASATWA